ncbi:hypothetical protein TA3x_003487 [Tundrisphaera sp. TA3]|uniref:hypothetical protein n=1 Tax=Tundrisphaera sp. TA3 TaxID=3435775 RepID=UPI003EBBEDF2
MNHCIDKIRAIVAEGRDDRRSLLQLGYNLGRLSELTGLGREPFWDRWKDAVAAWDRPALDRLARDLLELDPSLLKPDTEATGS